MLRPGPQRATRPSSARSLHTRNASDRLSVAMLHLLAETAAQEGKKTVLVMLLVGVVFLSVIALGELSHWLRHRR